MEWVLGLLAVTLLVAGVTWLVLRARRLDGFRRRGWEVTRHPGVVPVQGLNHPPFGRGGSRRVRELVSGSWEGHPFRAVAYDTTTDRPRGFVVTLPLGRSLPPLLAGDPRAFPEAPGGTPVPADGGVAALAADPAWAAAVLPCLAPLVADWPGAAVSVDGSTLVGLGCPDDGAALQAFLARLIPVATLLRDPRWDAFPGPIVPAGLAVAGHPTWSYRPRDDAALDHVRASRGGRSHRAEDVMVLNDPELGFIALTHHWETTRVVTTTNANGTVSSHTEVDHHREDICEFVLGVPFPDLSVNEPLGWGRDARVQFESDDFNRAFTVRAADARLVHAIFHPRQMEYVQTLRPPGFVIAAGRMILDWDGSVASLEAWLGFARGFLARVPAFVWDDLGVAPPNFHQRWLA